MNPFDLPGPEFLRVYFFLGLVTIAAVGVVWLATDVRRNLSWPKDPYGIAYLRGGPIEVVRLALFSLLARGYVRVDRRMISAVHEKAPSALPVPVEEAVLHAVAAPRGIRGLARDARIRVAIVGLRDDLARAGFVTDRVAFQVRARTILIAAVLLGSFALGKIVVALYRGRTNIGYLVALALLFGAILFLAWRYRGASTGRSAVASLKQLFGERRPVNARSPHLVHDPETMLTAAVAGVVGVPFASLGRAERSRVWSSGSGGGCGSVGYIGDSGGSDGGGGGGDGGGGSGCGGGGGGGGCGGCGGGSS